MRDGQPRHRSSTAGIAQAATRDTDKLNASPSPSPVQSAGIAQAATRDTDKLNASPSPSPVASHVSCMGEDTCLGALTAGTHTAPRFGIDFTVPAGWLNLTDMPGWFLLAPADDTQRGPWSGKYLAVIPDVAITEQQPDCAPSPDAGVGGTVADMVGYVTAHPGLVTSNVRPATIGGLAGQSVDLHVAPTWTTTCGDGFPPQVSLLTETNADGWRWNAGAGERQRLLFLDDGAGGVIVIAVNSPTPEGFDAMAQAAAPIVDSFRFHRGSATPSGAPKPGLLGRSASVAGRPAHASPPHPNAWEGRDGPAAPRVGKRFLRGSTHKPRR